MNINPLTSADFYKTGHIFQYPEGTEEVYSNFTPRSARLAPVNKDTFSNKVVWFGMQYLIKDFLIDSWDREFFNKPKAEVVGKYKRRLETSLGPIDVLHFEKLHDLGYLPIEIKALPEGARVNIGVPVFTIKNTVPEFYWITNYLETALSAILWKLTTNATIAYEYRKLLDKYAAITGTPKEFVQWQGHDFSMRGMSSLYDSSAAGAGHLLSFTGTDTISAIDFLEDFYNANAEKELIGGSVPATEHSTMCMGTQEGEIDTFRRLITKTYPTGIVSIVSDTWDFWKVISEYAKELKQEIMARQPNALGFNKVVFRPDSGDPVKVICGDADAPLDSPEYKGAVETLWDIYGGTITEKGYKVLDQHVGLIYGDSINLDRAQRILEGLEAKGFASCNIVFGIGSYTYQYNTRDSFGFAMKATHGIVNGNPREIFKNPKTDAGTKRSAKGLLRVELIDDNYVLFDQQTPEQEQQGELKTVFKNGKLTRETSLAEIRERLLG